MVGFGSGGRPKAANRPAIRTAAFQDAHANTLAEDHRIKHNLWSAAA
ncbi:MAG: hypothetical protein HY774_19470 [Acidobacteria bacterium]|nr:hypothetical protein [Acidobacteriota bacterium]